MTYLVWEYNQGNAVVIWRNDADGMIRNSFLKPFLIFPYTLNERVLYVHVSACISELGIGFSNII